MFLFIMYESVEECGGEKQQPLQGSSLWSVEETFVGKIWTKSELSMVSMLEIFMG